MILCKLPTHCSVSVIELSDRFSIIAVGLSVRNDAILKPSTARKDQAKALLDISKSIS